MKVFAVQAWNQIKIAWHIKRLLNNVDGAGAFQDRLCHPELQMQWFIKKIKPFQMKLKKAKTWG